MHLVLASQSRDRRKLFENAGVPVEVISSQFDESSLSNSDPFRLVQDLAEGKAREVEAQWINDRQPKDGPAIIIGADTMVLFEGKLIGKAHTEQEAFETLTRLSGHTHQLLTGVAVVNSATGQSETFMDKTVVHFQSLSSEEIWDYLRVTDEYLGRAGSYSLQERASLFIDLIEGSPTNVLGLPMAKLRNILQKYNISLLDPNSQ